MIQKFFFFSKVLKLQKGYNENLSLPFLHLPCSCLLQQVTPVISSIILSFQSFKIIDYKKIWNIFLFYSSFYKKDRI